MCLNTVPEVFKGYLKGVMKALAMQHRAVVINFAGCWLLQGSLVWLFVFKMNMGLQGIFLAKVLMEICLAIVIFTDVISRDWKQAVVDAQQR